REIHDSGEQEDKQIIEESLSWVDGLHLAQRDYATLSGGEKQRVQIARVLAQIWQGHQARFLFLDEPLNMLDMAHQHLCLNAFRQMAQRNVGVVMILHDINLAMQYADDIIVLEKGKIVANGAPACVVTVELLRQVFRVNASLLRDEQGAMFVKVDGYC
ncbi:MAG TPA: ATP-binding cassette domain-containing protein, partial [Pseudomonadales bacterium]|nr:ATP-binding cassette domain-containing protein [Pseudomonadales bacterium]